jgi:hypothetical protein
MHVKSWLMTGAVTAASAAALAIVIVGQTPSTADTALKAVVWVALILTVWGALTTLLLLSRVSLPAAVGAGITTTSGAVALAMLWRAGHHDFRLLGAVLFATLVVSVSVSWRLRAPHAHG